MRSITARKAAEMSEGLLTRRSAGRAAECSAPMSKRGRSSRVGGPKGALCARLASTQPAISARIASSSAALTAFFATR